MAWAEDRAPWRHDPSADPGAKTEGGAARCRPVFPLRDWHEGGKSTVSDQACSLPYLPNPVSPFHGEPVHYHALPADGALIVFEAIIDDERRSNAFGLLMSLNMLIETRGGFDYTGADCATWMREAGFRQTHVEHLSGPDSMIIGVK